MMEDFIMKPVYPAARALPTYENLLLEMVEPNILKVTLNRPKAYNALSHDLVRELTELSQWLVDESALSCCMAATRARASAPAWMSSRA